MVVRECEVVTDNEDIENRIRRVEELLQAIDIADEGGDDSQADELEEEAATLIGEIEELEAIAAEEEEEDDEEDDADDEDDEELAIAREAAIRQAIEEEAYLAEMAYIEEEEAAAEEEEAVRAEEEGAGGGVDPEELHKQVWEGFQNQNPSPQEVEKESLQKYHREMDRMAQEINRKVR